MTTEWSLDELYKGFDDPAYGKDVAELTAQIDALTTLLADAGRMQEKERTEKVLAAQSGIAQLFYQLSLYVELRQSVNTEDGTVMAENAKLMKNGTVRGRSRKAFSGNPGRGCAGKRE